MDFVVPEPILDCLGDLHGTPPQRDFWDFISQEGSVYDIFPIYSINLIGYLVS
jgi:hypothetical protein